MARRLMWKTAAAGAAAMTGILAAGLAPVQAATTPGWQFLQAVGTRTHVTTPQGLVATGRDDAWSLWRTCAPGHCTHEGTEVLEHWNGTTWSQRRPTALQKLRVPVALGASSARDVWVFGGQYGQRDKSTTALSWNGHAWHRHALPSWVIRRGEDGYQAVQAAVFGPRDVWVFSQAGGQGREERLAGRYNGSRWVKMSLPNVPIDISAVSRSDIWVLGFSAKLPNPYELMHWNGKRWSTRRIPESLAPSGSYVAASEVAATSSRGAWIWGAFEPKGTGPGTEELLHWTGHSWTVTDLPAVADNGGLTPDGAGGLWMSGEGGGDQNFFLHISGGQVSSYPVPTPQWGPQAVIYSLARVPGTTSVLATGWLSAYGHTGQTGAIWRYRR